MKVIDIRATDGPNYWSVRRHKLIVVLIDIEDLEELPTDKIPGFYNRLLKLIPTISEHYCSEGVTGGFLQRVQEGTWMGHVIEHIALELQTLAGMHTGFGRTRGAGKKGLYQVIFSYKDLEAGKYAALAAVRISAALVKDKPYNINVDIEALRSIAKTNRLGPSTASIVEEAIRRNIPVTRLNDNSCIQFGYGAAQQRIEATIASTTSSIAVETAGNKNATKLILQANYLPVPEGSVLAQEQQLPQIINDLGYPLVIKPLDASKGKGVTTSIWNYDEAVAAFKFAKKFSSKVICEKFIKGSDFRALVIDYKFTAAALRTPAYVTGDGVHTISQLVEIINRDPRRGICHENVLTTIKMDKSTLNKIRSHGFTTNTILPAGHTLVLKTTANLSTGGTAEDVTDLVHPDNIALFERVARLIGLNICGIDIMAPDLSTPITENDGVILEVNAAPGFRMHLAPSQGKPRNVGKAVVDMLFPAGKDGRIPIMAVTGTNGKTTTTRLLAHIAKHAGYNVGCTTTDGIYIQDQLILKGDCTGPQSTRAVLKDPAVNMAVLECARGGILRGGLGFDCCDVAIVTNIDEDHLGLDGIDTLEKLTAVKSVVPESVCPGGYAILNADDDRVYDMRESLRCNVALFSLHAGNARISEHTRQGGLAAVYENGYINLLNGRHVYRMASAADIPISFGGYATFNIANILPAALAAFTQKIPVEQIAHALKLFIPCPETIPGRMNIFDFNAFKVIVDYAHNTPGVKAIGSFIQSLPASRKIGVITGVGDRRDEDIASLGEEAAKIFDELIIRHDHDLRGRKHEDIDRLICNGVQKVAPSKKITIVPEELKAVETAIKNAEVNSLTVIFADNVKSVIQVVQNAFINRQAERGRAVA